MLNVLHSLRQALSRLRASDAPAVPEPDPDDPFAHPALAAMSLRDLADLPFPRREAEDAGAGDGRAAPRRNRRASPDIRPARRRSAAQPLVSSAIAARRPGPSSGSSSP
jgi:hypothetical protein